MRGRAAGTVRAVADGLIIKCNDGIRAALSTRRGALELKDDQQMIAKEEVDFRHNVTRTLY